jgi:hypothetical protein
LGDVSVSGLLVTVTTMGRDEWCRAEQEHRAELLDLERELSRIAELADSGKQLLAVGTAPRR